MKEKTDEELKKELNLTDIEIKELRIFDKVCIISEGDDYDIFSDIKESELMIIHTKSYIFYFINGERVDKEKYGSILKNNRKDWDNSL